MKYLTIGLVLSCLMARAQGSVKSVGKAQLPGVIPVTGQLIKALQWNDQAGQHFVVVTTTGIQQKPASDGEIYRSAKLSAKHFLQTGATVALQWEVKDGIADCPLDVTAWFIPETIQVTDLTKDGIPEVWMMYRTACRSDVSPAGLKLIMYEGKTKYAMRGNTRVPAGENRFMGGNYRFDSAFNRGATVFRTFANSLWEKYRNDTFE